MSTLRELLDARRYLPILALRPAEMTALEELPEKDKDLMIPLVLVKQWLSSGSLAKALGRITTAYGARPWICDVDPVVFVSQQSQGEASEFAAFADSSNGYDSWCKFIAANQQLIPCVQLHNAEEVKPQIASLVSLGRGLVVRLTREFFGQLKTILSLLNETGVDDVLFVLDFGQASESDLLKVAECVAYIDAIQASIPGCPIAVSATSFPDNFVGRTDKVIEERSFYNSIVAMRPRISLIFSDRGSARQERIGGGGGKPAPRIDYPTFDKWIFFRNEASDGYRRAAGDLMQPLAGSPKYWNPDLKIWGTQMIERTALGDPYGINTALKSTAVRLNIHMHKQIFYSDQAAAFGSDDEDWID